MTLKQRYLRVTNLLFVILIAVQFLPDRITEEPKTAYILWLATGIELIVLTVSALLKKPQKLSLFLDIVGFIFLF